MPDSRLNDTIDFDSFERRDATLNGWKQTIRVAPDLAVQDTKFSVTIRSKTFQSSLESSQQHAFFWLTMGNVVGVLLAAMLLWPEINRWITPLTYGRWIPLHLNLQLYGWTSIPLLGWLFVIYRVDDHLSPAWTRSALWGWSAALVVGSIAWLSGQTSGKIFLDWTGFSRRFLFLAISWIWVLLAVAWWKQGNASAGVPARLAWIAKAMGLLILLSVPPVLYWAAGSRVYPSVNPQSGGPTGASLLGSTLIVLLLLLLLPLSLGRRPVTRTWLTRTCWGVFGLHILLFFLLDRSNTSHHGLDQILGLGSLAVWVGLMPLYFQSFHWPAAAAPWQKAFLAWLTLLILTGFLSFLPGVLDRLKFTNGLVAHSHLAMAGFITAFNVFLLTTLRNSRINDRRLLHQLTFWIWNLSTLAYVILMWIAGWREGAEPRLVISPDLGTRSIYIMRLLCGVAMAGVSVFWWLNAQKQKTVSCAITSRNNPVTTSTHRN